MGIEYWLILLAMWVAIVFLWSYRRRLEQHRRSPYKSELDQAWEKLKADPKK